MLTEENRDVVMPRFFGLSSREAQELVAELQPRPVPSTRMVVTGALSRPAPSAASITLPLLSLRPGAAGRCAPERGPSFASPDVGTREWGRR